VALPWEHPDLGAFDPPLRELLLHAQDFSEVMHGAPLLYNLMLAEVSHNDERIAQYREELSEWATALAAREAELKGWDEKRFWAVARSQGARIGPMAQTFVDRWRGILRGLAWPPDVTGHQGARELVASRERALKQANSRLDNRRALERWNGAAGTDQISYRWGKTQGLVNDLVGALKGGNEHA
jgi:hypothetical protein